MLLLYIGRALSTWAASGLYGLYSGILIPLIVRRWRNRTAYGPHNINTRVAHSIILLSLRADKVQSLVLQARQQKAVEPRTLSCTSR